MRALRLALALTLAALAPAALAGTLTAELSRTEGAIGDAFQLTLFVEGSLEGEPAVPEVPGLFIRRTGYKQSVNIVNGQTYPEISLIYTIHPQQSGVFRIPGITATVDGKVETTVPLTLTVHGQGQGTAQGQAAPDDPAQGQAQTAPQGRQGRGGARGGQAHADTGGVFIERECSTASPYVGEQVVCAVRVHHRDNLVGGQRLSQSSPELRRFQAEGERRYVRAVNGQRYSVIELREILVPQVSGDVEVPPFTLQARVLSWSRRNNPLDKFFDSFGGGAFNFDFNFTEEKEVVVKSDAQALAVKPLPTEGQPPGFQGVVGSYQLTASVSRERVAAGETVTITIALSGEGILDSISDVKPALDAIGRMYADKPEYKEEVEGTKGIRSSKTFKYALVPRTAGEYPLGAIEVPVFDPKLQQYTVLRSDLGTLIVEPGQAEERPLVVGAQPAATSEGREDVRLLGQDLIGPSRRLDLASSDAMEPGDWVAVGVIGGVPMAFAFGLMGAGWVRARRGADPVRQRKARALKQAAESLDAARATCGQGQLERGLAEAHRAFRVYLGDKLALPAGSALATREVERHLVSLGVPDAARERAGALLARFDRVEFGGRAPAPEEARQWIDELQKLLTEIERA